MKIISNKEYNKLKKTQSEYLDLLMKPLQGVFEKITDDDLLRENSLLNAENERLNNIIKEAIEFIEKYHIERKVKIGNVELDKSFVNSQGVLEILGDVDE